MKNYQIIQYSGNLNKWTEPTSIIGITNISEDSAKEYNNRFATTGQKYIEIATGVQAGEFKGMKAGDKVGDKTLRKVSQGYLNANPLVTGVKVGDLWPM